METVKQLATPQGELIESGLCLPALCCGGLKRGVLGLSVRWASWLLAVFMDLDET